MNAIKQYKALVKKEIGFAKAGEVEDTAILVFHMECVKVKVALADMLGDFKGGNKVKVYKMYSNLVKIILNVENHLLKVV